GLLKVEVASIKKREPDQKPLGVQPAPGGRRYTGVAVPLRSYLYVAYQVRSAHNLLGTDLIRHVQVASQRNRDTGITSSARRGLNAERFLVRLPLLYGGDFNLQQA